MRNPMSRVPFLSCIALALLSAPLAAQESSPAGQHGFSNAQVFALADAARDAGDYDRAEQLYRALIEHEKGDLRREALFRLALMFANQQLRYSDAAVLLRMILDEQPDAARVRVELARLQAAMGNLREAERELRAAEAIGLPPAVEQLVRFYTQALNAQRSVGGSLRVAIAPDSNINRATGAGSLETIIGDFDLDEDAQETSGIGLSTRAQAFVRHGLKANSELLLRLSASGDFYKKHQFDDYTVALQMGPQLNLEGGRRLNLSAAVSHRWFGRESLSFNSGVNADYSLPLSKKARLTVTGSYTRHNDLRNDLQDGDQGAASVAVDAAFGARSGGGFSLSGVRLDAEDPGYALVNAGLQSYIYREIGTSTFVLEVGYSHLEADSRLFLYPRRRVDDRASMALSGTFRTLRIGRFAPLMRVEYERNNSTVGIYDYDRIATQLGLTAAF